LKIPFDIFDVLSWITVNSDNIYIYTISTCRNIISVSPTHNNIYTFVRLVITFINIIEYNVNVIVNLPHLIWKSLKVPKGGNQNPYIEEEQTTQ
jgi:hypothetical protein